VRTKNLLLSGSSNLPYTVASRIISWISGASLRLDVLLQRGLSDGVSLNERSGSNLTTSC
jgi:hypothetical protein